MTRLTHTPCPVAHMVARSHGNATQAHPPCKLAKPCQQTTRADELQPGATRSEQLFDWPSMLSAARLHDEACLVHNSLRQNRVAYSDYSGIACHRVALRLRFFGLTSRVATRTCIRSHLVFARSCNTRACQHRVLRNMGQLFGGGQSCVCHGLEDRLISGARTWLDSATPSRGSAMSERAAAYRTMIAWLMDNRPWVFQYCSHYVVHIKA